MRTKNSEPRTQKQELRTKNPQPKATWGKIKNWDKLNLIHREMLSRELNPIYKPVADTKIFIGSQYTDLIERSTEYLLYIN